MQRQAFGLVVLWAQERLGDSASGHHAAHTLLKGRTEDCKVVESMVQEHLMGNASGRHEVDTCRMGGYWGVGSAVVRVRRVEEV